jgi:hypothetical protein
LCEYLRAKYVDIPNSFLRRGRIWGLCWIGGRRFIQVEMYRIYIEILLHEGHSYFMLCLLYIAKAQKSLLEANIPKTSFKSRDFQYVTSFQLSYIEESRSTSSTINIPHHNFSSILSITHPYWFPDFQMTWLQSHDLNWPPNHTSHTPAFSGSCSRIRRATKKDNWWRTMCNK